jgi:hypothetical protein
VTSTAASELLPAIKAVLHGKQFLSAILKDSNLVDTAGPGREKVTASSPLANECHQLRLCADDADLVNGFSRSIGVALDNGDASLIIATESHRAHLLRNLGQMVSMLIPLLNEDFSSFWTQLTRSRHSWPTPRLEKIDLPVYFTSW